MSSSAVATNAISYQNEVDNLWNVIKNCLDQNGQLHIRYPRDSNLTAVEALFKKNEALETKTNRKQIDICDKTKSFYIEFDGPTHFKPIYGIETFENTKKRDLLTEDFILKNNKTLIRISFDQFKDQRKNGGFFKEDCLKKLYYILDSKLKGIYKIGDKYE